MLVAHTAIDLMPFLLAVGVVVVCSVLWCWRFPAKTTGLVKSPAGIPIIGTVTTNACLSLSIILSGCGLRTH